MYIKDMTNGHIRKYGEDCHDSLVISNDGRTLSYYNLQNGDGSKYGDYRITDEEGKIPTEIEEHLRYGANIYFNIGGFKERLGVNKMQLIYDICEIKDQHKITDGEPEEDKIYVNLADVIKIIQSEV